MRTNSVDLNCSSVNLLNCKVLFHFVNLSQNGWKRCNHINKPVCLSNYNYLYFKFQVSPLHSLQAVIHYKIKEGEITIMGQGRFLYIILSVLYVIEVSRQFISQFSSYTPVNLFLRGEIIQICDQLELLFLSIALTPPPPTCKKAA